MARRGALTEMAVILELDNQDLQRFTVTAAQFGTARFGYVVTPNADHVIRYFDDAWFRTAYADAEFVLCDSRFLAYLLAARKGLQVPVCTGSDLTQQLITQVARPDDRLVLVGATEEQAGILASKFGLTGLRHMNPPMGFVRDEEEVRKVLEFVESHSPFRFCLIAVGCPQQETIAQRLKQRGIARGLALCVGASVDFVTGKEQRAPKLMQKLGIEWVFRLLQSPRRLGRRYLVRGPRIFGVLRRLDIRLRNR
jgi:N-acetylglucosaminyldiphosphoundecaprenol N-acetyl-beta-D-mannosaminyltransferase